MNQSYIIRQPLPTIHDDEDIEQLKCMEKTFCCHVSLSGSPVVHTLLYIIHTTTKNQANTPYSRLQLKHLVWVLQVPRNMKQFLCISLHDRFSHKSSKVLKEDDTFCVKEQLKCLPPKLLLTPVLKSASELNNTKTHGACNVAATLIYFLSSHV